MHRKRAQYDEDLGILKLRHEPPWLVRVIYKIIGMKWKVIK
jgi:hypothetical protein